jgi:hypothetical protein
MFSLLKPSLVYKDISPDVTEQDEDYDASEWTYSGRNVYRGALDRSYSEWNLDVYWLYDDSLQRVGLAEHDMDDPAIFEVLWFRDTPFGTLLQEDGWKVDKSLWEMMTPEAYQDAINSDLLLKCHGKFITPDYIINGIPDMYECSECHKRSFSQFECQTVKKIKKDFENLLFVDSSFVVYRKSETSKLSIEHGVCVLKQQQEKELSQLETPLHPPEQPVLPLEE